MAPVGYAGQSPGAIAGSLRPMPPVIPQALIAVGAAILVTQLSNLATTIYLHRALAHRAMTLHPLVAFPCRVLVWISTGITPREWVAVHRKHHAHTDREGDPHSPALLGWRRVQLTNLFLYRRAAREAGIVERYARDLTPDRWDRWLFDRGVLGLGIGIGILVVTLGPAVGVAAALLHAVTYVQLNSAVNALGHTFGSRPSPNSGTNMRWLALLTAGEGLHNNHHAAPTSATMRMRPGEIDPAWPLIWLGAKARLIRLRLDPAQVRR